MDADDRDDQDYLDDDGEGEPVGSCDNCGENLYEDDDDELCEQCLWWSKQ